MKTGYLKSRIRYYWQYFPFTLNTLFIVLAAWGAIYLLYKPVPKGERPSALIPFILLMGKIALMLVAGVIIVSALSTVVCWAYYLYLKKTKGITLRLGFTTEQKNNSRSLFLNASIDNAWRPLLGFVKGRIIYDDDRMTDRFSLLTAKKKDASGSAAITGKSRLLFPDVKEYDIKGGFLYFQDMLHLFSLAVQQPVSGHFYQPPVLMTGDEQEIAPKKTETLDVRIDQLRRVEGEYLNYKDFESGDDVRRIVWKVYAKNRELVVRVPELFEPYASHLYCYASFHTLAKNKWLGEEYQKEMLNYFKNCAWTVFDTLSRKEWKVNFICDQQINIPEMAENSEKVARTISNCAWHSDKDLLAYFNPRNGSVLCISSFTDPAMLAQLLERCDGSTVIYFAKLSRTFRHYIALGWLSRLIFLSPADRLSRLRTSWTFSPMRIQVNRREKEIEHLLEKSAVIWTVL
jgi:hypothetical protein